MDSFYRKGIDEIKQFDVIGNRRLFFGFELEKYWESKLDEFIIEFDIEIHFQ